MYERILVPLDGSPLAESVLPWVEDLAARVGAQVTLLMAAELPGDRGGGEPSIYFITAPEAVAVSAFNPESPAHQQYLSQVIEQMELRMKAYLATVEARFQARGVAVQSAAIFGYPADQIVEYAAKNGVDLIAMATHGRTGVRRWMQGSVAEEVLHAASIPVLLVRASEAGGGA